MAGDGSLDDEIERLRRDLGRKIRDLRMEKGLSQERLAHDCGLDRTFVSNIEMGQRRPSLDVLFRLARGLGLTLSKLFEGLGP